MKDYAIVLSTLDKNYDSLFHYNYVNIKGKSPKDAIEKHYGIETERVTGDDARYSDIIVMAGKYDSEDNVFSGKLRNYCYKII